jgi:hypothetical protein
MVTGVGVVPGAVVVTPGAPGVVVVVTPNVPGVGVVVVAPGIVVVVPVGQSTGNVTSAVAVSAPRTYVNVSGDVVPG